MRGKYVKKKHTSICTYTDIIVDCRKVNKSRALSKSSVAFFIRSCRGGGLVSAVAAAACSGQRTAVPLLGSSPRARLDWTYSLVLLSSMPAGRQLPTDHSLFATVVCQNKVCVWMLRTLLHLFVIMFCDSVFINIKPSKLRYLLNFFLRRWNTLKKTFCYVKYGFLIIIVIKKNFKTCSKYTPFRV